MSILSIYSTHSLIDVGQTQRDSGYGNDDDVDSTTTVESVHKEGIWENGRSYHSYNAGRKYLSSTNPFSILPLKIADSPSLKVTTFQMTK